LVTWFELAAHLVQSGYCCKLHIMIQNGLHGAALHHKGGGWE